MLILTKSFAVFKNIKPGELFTFMDNNSGVWCKTPFADMQDSHNNEWNDGHERFCTAICVNSHNSKVTFTRCDPNARVILIDAKKVFGDF